MSNKTLLIILVVVAIIAVVVVLATRYIDGDGGASLIRGVKDSPSIYEMTETPN